MMPQHQHLHIEPHRFYPTCRAAMHDLKIHLERFPSIRFGIVKDFDQDKKVRWLLYRVHEQKQADKPPFQAA